MARKVYISSDMSEDEVLSEVADINPLIALLWPWFISNFDDWGRAQASPKRIKNRVFPANDLVSTEIIKEALDLYHQNNLIRLYEVNGKEYMSIDPDKWFGYQTHIRKEKRENDGSKIPPPPLDDDNCAQLRAGTRDNVLDSEDERFIAELLAENTNRATLDMTASRDCAQEREKTRICTPSPTPSLSPSNNSSGSSNSAANVFGMYEREIGELTKTVSDKLIDLEEFYTEEWLKKAIETAVFQGVKKIAYIDGILSRWKKTNHPEPWTLEKQKEQRPTGNRYQRNSRPMIAAVQPSQSTGLTPEELERARQLAAKMDSQRDDMTIGRDAV